MALRPTSSIAPPVWATILAGGVGSRFWPLSTPRRPKQLLALAGAAPLVAQTVERAEGIAPRRRIRVLAGEAQVAPIREAAGLGHDAFLVEPRQRGTGPALARAAWEAARADPGAVMVSLHSDHVISPDSRFREVVGAAVEIAAREALLLTVAVPPDRPETGFGYIRPGEPLDAPGGHAAFRVDAFVEKPDAETAARYVAQGYRWNSGIFVWPAELFLDEVRASAPEIARALPCLERGDVGAFFDEAEAISVDEAVLERSGRVAAVEATFDWDDLGSWEAFARHRAPDRHGNVREGDVHAAGAFGNIAVADSGRIVLLGASDLLVVQTGHATLVMPRSESARLKDYLRQLDGAVARGETDAG